MLLKVNREGLEAALASIGAHADSLPIFAHKAEDYSVQAAWCAYSGGEYYQAGDAGGGRRCRNTGGAVTCAAKVC